MRRILYERCQRVFRGHVNEWVCPACRKKAVRNWKEEKRAAAGQRRKEPFWKDWER